MDWIATHLHSLWILIRYHPWTAIASIVTCCSTLHTFLPPYDWKPEFVEQGLADFPGLQKAFYSVFNSRYYKLAIYTVGYIAIAGRSTVWRSISIKNPDSVNVKKILNGHANGTGPQQDPNTPAP